MRRDRRLVVVRVTQLVLAALVLGSGTGCGSLDRDAVSTELKAIQSSAAEGMLVAQQAARERAPASFIEIRTAELAKVSANAANTLAETPAESGLQQAAGRGREIGNRASEILDELHGNPGDASLARTAATELQSLHEEAGRVEESL